MSIQLVLTLALTILGSTYCQETPIEGDCSENGDLRLVHQQGDNFGALQVCVSDGDFKWRYVVIWQWTERAARLACKQLDLPYLDPVSNTLKLTKKVNVRRVDGYSCVEGAELLYDCIANPEGKHNFVLTLNCSNGDLPREYCNTDSVTTCMAKSMDTSKNDTTLEALLGLLVVILAAVLAGWIVTCVYLQRKINKKTKDHTHPVSRSNPAFQLNNTVYGDNLSPQHTTYSSLGPAYKNNTNEGEGHNYDVIDRPRPPTSVLESAPSGGGVRVVEGAYSQVGESNPQDYEVPIPTVER